MMNHHMPAGPGQPHVPPNMPMHHHSRRQQEYHAYHYGPPQSPIHPYAGYPHQPYYSHQPPPPPPPHYLPPRWHLTYIPQTYMQPHHQHPPPPPPPPPPQQAQQPVYQPRSPMVVYSQPYAQPMTPVTRQTPKPHLILPQPTQSPLPTTEHVPQQQKIQSDISSPAALPSPAPTPKPDQVPISPSPQQQSTASSPSELHIRRQSIVTNPLSLPPEYKTPYYPRLPWYSHEDGEAGFPRREMTRRKIRLTMHNPIESVALPARTGGEEVLHTLVAEEPSSGTSTIAAPSEPETPATSQAPSESEFAHIATSATPAQTAASLSKAPPTPVQGRRRDTRTAIAVPNIAGLSRRKASPPDENKRDTVVTPTDDSATKLSEPQSADADGEKIADEATTPKIAPPKLPLKSWADLVRSNAPVFGATAGVMIGNGITAGGALNGFSLPKSASLADALSQYSVKNDAKLSFIEPRGLVNTGNMCYMNSILQVLIFCVPFYDFLEQVQRLTIHSQKSETPLVDAMIMFMREFKVLASAESGGILRAMLSQQQLEQYGDPVTPEYVYDAIRKLDRFNSMRRGHQQDAEEFLGFLLEGLHDECVAVMHGSSAHKLHEDAVPSPTSLASQGSGDGWLEVGPKQKASVTRQAGNQDAPSPITKIFGGNLRSELRVPGQKDSVTLEQYKPLQLDIGAQHVSNIVDALKGLTRTESLTGDFGGRTNTAKKQVFIDTLPPVLILHLKRFQYENNLTGTQKIWKKVGYPLELEIPKELFTPSKRSGLAINGGLPKYRLISVVYHHGKSAAGGHYTVDVLREDGREWIRMDDTVIRRIRPEDVAEGGAEEDPKLLAKALEQHKADQDFQKQRNFYQGLDEMDREPEEEKPWSEVNGHASAGHKKWSSIATTNGTATPTSNAAGKHSPATWKDGPNTRDNKVAYILLYERVNA